MRQPDVSSLLSNSQERSDLDLRYMASEGGSQGQLADLVTEIEGEMWRTVSLSVAHANVDSASIATSHGTSIHCSCRTWCMGARAARILSASQATVSVNFVRHDLVRLRGAV